MPEADQPLPIYPWHAETIRCWGVVWRQWRWLVGMGGAVRQGLDFQQVESALRLMGIDAARWPTIFAGLRTMEQEALQVMAARQA